MAVFWGQSTEGLSDVCANDNIDIFILALVTSLLAPKLNLGKDTGSASTAQVAKNGWGLFDATVAGADRRGSVAEQIRDYQGAGKKVMISFGETESMSNATFSAAPSLSTAWTWTTRRATAATTKTLSPSLSPTLTTTAGPARNT